MRALLLLIAIQSWAATTVTITRPGTAKAGVSGSITLTVVVTGPAGTGLWTAVSGPATATFGTPTATSTTYTAPTRSTTSADYVVQFAYTNSDGVTTSAPTHVGAVLVDANDVVITGADSRIDAIIGPQLRWGSSTAIGTYFDIADRALADTISVAALADPPHLGTAFTGTFQALNSPGRLVGTGSLLTSECAAIGLKCALILGWNDPIDGAGTGRHWDNCLVVDDTHCTLDDFTFQFTVGSGLTLYRQASTTATFQCQWWGQCGGAQNSSWNYYGGLDLGNYRLWYRTGEIKYLTYARQATDYWWTWAIDHGTKGQAPRVINMQAQFVRAIDGKSERLPSLYNYAIYFAGTIQIPHDQRGTLFDAREAAYTTWALANGAAVDTNSGRHTTYCSTLSTWVDAWIANQQPAGFWSEDLFGYNGGGYPYYPPGSSPWRTDIPIHGLQAAYEVLLDATSAGCNLPVKAASLLVTITKAVEWAYNAGRALAALGGNGGVYYDAGYESLGQTNITIAGTFSVANGGTAVTGVGSLASQLACDGSRYIGFITPLTMYRVMSCTDDTHFTIFPAYGFWGEVGALAASSATGAARAYPCKNAFGGLCSDGAINEGDRSLSRLMGGMTGWLYNKTGRQLYRDWGDQWVVNFAGGPADGPGGVLACNGTGCDGTITNWEWALPYCGTPNPPPCTNDSNFTDNVYRYLGKNWGQASGAPGTPNHLAWRVKQSAIPPRSNRGRGTISGKVAR